MGENLGRRTSMWVLGGGLAHGDGGGNKGGARKGRKAQRRELTGVRGMGRGRTAARWSEEDGK